MTPYALFPFISISLLLLLCSLVLPKLDTTYTPVRLRLRIYTMASMYKQITMTEKIGTVTDIVNKVMGTIDCSSPACVKEL